jgi:hypothetical protein
MDDKRPPPSPCPQLQSIALVAAGRNAAIHAGRAEFSHYQHARGATEADKVAEAQELPSSVQSGALGDTGGGQSRSRFQRGNCGVRLSGGRVRSGCECAPWFVLTGTTPESVSSSPLLAIAATPEHKLLV